MDTIITSGCSFTSEWYGYDTTGPYKDAPYKSWPYWLREKGYNVINVGFSGSGNKQILRRAMYEALKHIEEKPKLIVQWTANGRKSVMIAHSDYGTIFKGNEDDIRHMSGFGNGTRDWLRILGLDKATVELKKFWERFLPTDYMSTVRLNEDFDTIECVFLLEQFCKANNLEWYSFIGLGDDWSPILNERAESYPDIDFLFKQIDLSKKRFFGVDKTLRRWSKEKFEYKDIYLSYHKDGSSDDEHPSPKVHKAFTEEILL